MPTFVPSETFLRTFGSFITARIFCDMAARISGVCFAPNLTATPPCSADLRDLRTR